MSYVNSNKLIKTTILSASLIVWSAGSSLSACYISQGNGDGASMEQASDAARRNAAAPVNGRYANASYSEPICFVVDRTDGPPSYGCEVDYSYCDGPATVSPPKHVNKKTKRFGAWHKRYSWNSKIRFGSHKRRHSNTCLKFTASAKHRTETKSIRLAERSLDKSLRKNTGYGFNSTQVSVADPQCWQTTPGIVNCSIEAKYCQ